MCGPEQSSGRIMTVRENKKKLDIFVKYLVYLVKILIHRMRGKMSWGDSVPAKESITLSYILTTSQCWCPGNR